MDPKGFIEYTSKLGTELACVAAAGHRHIVDVRSHNVTALIAFGPEQSEFLSRMIGKLMQDPEWIAFNSAKRESNASMIVGAMATERN